MSDTEHPDNKATNLDESTVGSDSDSDTMSTSSGSSHSSSNSGSSGSGSEGSSDYEIDLSDNEIYKGIYSFFEDEEGNTILDYISLLHTEMIGMHKAMLNMKLMRRDVTRIADAFEKMVALKEAEMEEKKNRKHNK